MDKELLQFLIVCPLLFLAGFVDSIAGGGGLISLPGYLIAGFPPINAVATNKMSAGMGAVVSFAKYAKEGYINFKLAVPCVITSIIGANIGARIALLLDDKVFKIILLIILPLTAIYISKAKIFKKEIDTDYIFTYKSYCIANTICFLIGIYDGFYGPGTGTFLIITFTTFLHLSMKSANGLAKAVNLATNVGALVVYIINGKIYFPLGITAGIFNMAGAYIGTHIFKLKGLKIVKPIMFVVLTLFFIKIIIELIQGV